MEIVTVSKFLKNMKVWHKVEGRYIRTKKMRVKIPKVTDKVAYLVGVITGDGTIVACKRKKGEYHYLIRLWGSKEKLTHMPKLLSDLFCCKSKIFKDKRKRNCYFIDVRGAALFAYFVQFGLPVGKKRELAVPKSIAGNPSLFRNYMLGLIETDGHVHNQRVQLKQRDENFLEELVKLLEKNLSIKSNPPKVNYTEGKPYYYIRFPITLLQSDST